MWIQELYVLRWSTNIWSFSRKKPLKVGENRLSRRKKDNIVCPWFSWSKSIFLTLVFSIKFVMPARFFWCRLCFFIFFLWCVVVSPCLASLTLRIFTFSSQHGTTSKSHKLSSTAGLWFSFEILSMSAGLEISRFHMVKRAAGKIPRWQLLPSPPRCEWQSLETAVLIRKQPLVETLAEHARSDRDGMCGGLSGNDDTPKTSTQIQYLLYHGECLR